jgi:regulator of replication initiation timing
MRGKQELYKMGVLALTQMAGGQNAILEQLAEAQKQGHLTKKQAYDIRQTIKEACHNNEGLTVPNEAIEELSRKIKEAAKFFR